MPRGMLTKVDMLSRLFKLKRSIYDRSGKYSYWSQDKIDAANQAINDVLDIIEEYSQ